MRCPTCHQENPPLARFCMGCGRPLSSHKGARLSLLFFLPALAVIAFLGGILLSRPSPATPVRAIPSPATPVRAIPTPTAAYAPLTPDNIHRLRVIGRLRLTPREGLRWIPSADWKVWVQFDEHRHRIYVHRLGEEGATLIEAPGSISILALSPDGTRVAAIQAPDLSLDPQLRMQIWRAGDGEILADTEVPIDVPGKEDSQLKAPVYTARQVSLLTFSPNGRYLAVCCPESRGGIDRIYPVWIYDLQIGGWMQATGWEVKGFAWLPDGRFLLLNQGPQEGFGSRPKLALFTRRPLDRHHPDGRRPSPDLGGV